MKTRFLFTLLSAVLCSVSVFAQDDFITVDWKELKSTVARNPQEVTDKVETVLALDPDSSLPFEDMVVAFYGQSLLTNDREEPYVREMFELYSEKNIFLNSAGTHTGFCRCYGDIRFISGLFIQGFRSAVYNQCHR